MKAKTINAIVSAKMKQWWATIEDTDLREKVEKETIVTGGAVASMLLNEKVSDFDVYLQTFDTAKAVADYYVKRFHVERKGGISVPVYVEFAPPLTGPEAADDAEKIAVVIGKDGKETPRRFGRYWIAGPEGRVRIVAKSAGVASEEGTELDYQYFESRPPEEAQAYVDDIMGSPSDADHVGGILDLGDEMKDAPAAEGKPYRPVFLSTNAITLANKVQVILRFFGSPEAIHANYDFVHCTNYWTKATGVVLNQPALESLLTRELRYVGSRYPVCSLIRTRKFISRGWTINAGQFVKMAFQVGGLDLENVHVLEDQLTGVDVAYFNQVISALKEKGGERVDGAYLLTIINRMF